MKKPIYLIAESLYWGFLRAKVHTRGGITYRKYQLFAYFHMQSFASQEVKAFLTYRKDKKVTN